MLTQLFGSQGLHLMKCLTKICCKHRYFLLYILRRLCVSSKPDDQVNNWRVTSGVQSSLLEDGITFVENSETEKVFELRSSAFYYTFFSE